MKYRVTKFSNSPDEFRKRSPQSALWMAGEMLAKLTAMWTDRQTDGRTDGRTIQSRTETRKFTGAKQLKVETPSDHFQRQPIYWGTFDITALLLLPSILTSQL